MTTPFSDGYPHAKPGDLIMTADSMYVSDSFLLGGIYHVCRHYDDIETSSRPHRLLSSRIGVAIGTVGQINDMIAVLMPDNKVYAMWTQHVRRIGGVDESD